MKSCLAGLVAVLTLITAVPAKAAVSPLSVGILPPVQFPPSDFDVAGLRASLLWGEHRSMYGFDFGVIGNITDVNYAGLAVSGIFNITHASNTTILGLQAAGIANVNTNKTSVTGIQIAGLFNNNVQSSSVTGLQLALVNMAAFTNIYGFQVGLYNKALDVYGFQIGIVNMCSSLHGLQIGLINFQEKGLFAVSPILNFGF